MAAITICSDFGACKNKVCHCFYCFPIYLPWVMGPDAMTSVFWILSFKPTFPLSSFIFIKRLVSSSLSAVRVVSSAHLMLVIFLPAILIPTCASSSLVFHMMYSAYKLNKQDDNIQPWCTPFPTWSQSTVPKPALTVASWPAHIFLRKQVRWSGIPTTHQSNTQVYTTKKLSHRFLRRQSWESCSPSFLKTPAAPFLTLAYREHVGNISSLKLYHKERIQT